MIYPYIITNNQWISHIDLWYLWFIMGIYGNMLEYLWCIGPNPRHPFWLMVCLGVIKLLFTHGGLPIIIIHELRIPFWLGHLFHRCMWHLICHQWEVICQTVMSSKRECHKSTSQLNIKDYTLHYRYLIYSIIINI